MASMAQAGKFDASLVVRSISRFRSRRRCPPECFHREGFLSVQVIFPNLQCDAAGPHVGRQAVHIIRIEIARNVIGIHERDSSNDKATGDGRLARTVWTGKHPNLWPDHSVSSETRRSSPVEKSTNSFRPSGYSLMTQPGGVSSRV